MEVEYLYFISPIFRCYSSEKKKFGKILKKKEKKKNTLVHKYLFPQFNRVQSAEIEIKCDK